MGLCKDCRWWDLILDRRGDPPFVAGSCEAIHPSALNDHYDALQAMKPDEARGGYDDSWLITGPHFGCVQFDQRDIPLYLPADYAGGPETSG